MVNADQCPSGPRGKFFPGPPIFFETPFCNEAGPAIPTLDWRDSAEMKLNPAAGPPGELISGFTSRFLWGKKGKRGPLPQNTPLKRLECGERSPGTLNEIPPKIGFPPEN